MASYTKVPAKNKQGYKYVCVIDGPSDPITGKRKQISRRGNTQKEALKRAEAALDELINQEESEEIIAPPTFEEVANDWHATFSKRKIKPATKKKRLDDINLLLRFFTNVMINQITHKMYQDMLNKLDDDDYALNTMKGLHVTANMIFEYAIKHKFREDNPCKDAVIPERIPTVAEIESNPIEEKYLERSELTEFLGTVLKHGLPLDLERFYLLAFSGMRPGELCALKVNDFNFDTNEVRISKTLYNETGKMTEYEVVTPKTKGSIRSVSVDKSVMIMIKSLIDRRQVIMTLNKKIDPNWHDEGFVFCRDNGYPFITNAIVDRMKRILKKTGIKKNATPHILRHTHVSMLAEAGVDLKTVMQRVGHEDPNTTLKIYTHVTNKMKKNADEKIKIHFADILSFKFSNQEYGSDHSAENVIFS
ncbi:tyrosine-type recombinase/integrase [Paenibacillus motobuensis]|uniref:Site-specific integrase n=1 Tax=Paenibacillus motobuensis TaxID=295324 RepID=A0ABN0YC33_9BACL